VRTTTTNPTKAKRAPLNRPRDSEIVPKPGPQIDVRGEEHRLFGSSILRSMRRPAIAMDCVPFDTIVLCRIRAATQTRFRLRIAGIRSDKLFLTPTLLGASRCRRELHVSDRQPEFQRCAVWHVPTMPFTRPALRDRRYAAAALPHVPALRFCLVARALIHRPPLADRRNIVGRASRRTTLLRRRCGIHGVSVVWRTRTAPHTDDNVVLLLPLPQMRAELVSGTAWRAAERRRVAAVR
jgi:hypothetical protein